MKKHSPVDCRTVTDETAAMDKRKHTHILYFLHIILVLIRD